MSSTNYRGVLFEGFPLREVPPYSGKRKPNLYIIVRVPVRVIDDDGICRSQVNSQTPSPGREQEYKLFRGGGVEAIDTTLSLGSSNVSINSLKS